MWRRIRVRRRSAHETNDFVDPKVVRSRAGKTLDQLLSARRLACNLGLAQHHTLPDFYIGAHAAVEGMALLTRDRVRYASYFPSVKLIAP